MNIPILFKSLLHSIVIACILITMFALLIAIMAFLAKHSLVLETFACIAGIGLFGSLWRDYYLWLLHNDK